MNGVALRDAGGAKVADLTISAIGAGGVEGEDVSAGIFVKGSDDVDLRDNRVSNDVDAFQADGIVVLASKRVELTGNDTSANAWNGMVVVDSPRARVLSNRTVGNGNSGIFVASAPSVRIARNVAGDHEKPDTAGIAMLQVTGGVVVGNRLRGNRASGIAMENGTTSTTVARNRIRGGGDGIAVLDSNDNTVVRNRVMDAEGVGILLDEFFGEDGSDGNRIAHNSISRGGLAGILVTGPSTSNTLSENLASRNASDGIRVRTAGNRLELNTPTATVAVESTQWPAPSTAAETAPAATACRRSARGSRADGRDTVVDGHGRCVLDGRPRRLRPDRSGAEYGRGLRRGRAPHRLLEARPRHAEGTAVHGCGPTARGSERSPLRAEATTRRPTGSRTEPRSDLRGAS